MVNGYYPSIALVGGSAAGAVLEKLFLSKDRTCGRPLPRPAVMGFSELQRLRSWQSSFPIRLSPVRQAAIQALGMYANWRYPAAQTALIQLATDKSADAADRVNATDALGYAVRLQVKGVRQDPAMFRALVTLLQDKDEPVRSAASLGPRPCVGPRTGRNCATKFRPPPVAGGRLGEMAGRDHSQIGCSIPARTDLASSFNRS